MDTLFQPTYNNTNVPKQNTRSFTVTPLPDPNSDPNISTGSAVEQALAEIRAQQAQQATQSYQPQQDSNVRKAVSFFSDDNLRNNGAYLSNILNSAVKSGDRAKVDAAMTRTLNWMNKSGIAGHDARVSAFMSGLGNSLTNANTFLNGTSTPTVPISPVGNAPKEQKQKPSNDGLSTDFIKDIELPEIDYTIPQDITPNPPKEADKQPEWNKPPKNIEEEAREALRLEREQRQKIINDSMINEPNYNPNLSDNVKILRQIVDSREKGWPKAYEILKNLEASTQKARQFGSPIRENTYSPYYKSGLFGNAYQYTPEVDELFKFMEDYRKTNY